MRKRIWVAGKYSFSKLFLGVDDYLLQKNYSDDQLECHQLKQWPVLCHVSLHVDVELEDGVDGH